MKPLTVPEDLKAPIAAIAAAGGIPWIVGGAVRDFLMGIEPKDFDVETFNLSLDDIVKALSSFGWVDIVGKSFGVVKLSVNGNIYDFSIPRIETKTDDGHRGFDVTPNPYLPLVQAAARRDFTCNAIYFNPVTQEYSDPFGGIEDINRKVLKHTSGAFSEDPLRVLRAFQFCSRFGFTVDKDTVYICRGLKKEFPSLSKERLWVEWEKWASKSTQPELGLQFLRDCEWWELFPHISVLDCVVQDAKNHPEGSVWNHTLECVKALRRLDDPVEQADKLVVTFAIFGHDFGKITHTQIAPDGKITAYGHDDAGGPLIAEFLKSIDAPRHIISQVVNLVENHMMQHNDVSLRTVRRAATRLHPANLRQLCQVMEADKRGRPPKPDVCSEKVKLIREMAKEMSLETQAPKPIVMGRHLIDAGMVPSNKMGPILAVAMEAQLEGHITNLEDGLKYLREKGLLA